MQFILVIFILLLPIASLLLRDALCNKTASTVEVVSKDHANPEAHRQCVETKRNTSIEIKLNGHSFIQNPLCYATLNTPDFGMLVDYNDSILTKAKWLKDKNVLTYTPERDFVGVDRFHFVVFDLITGEISEAAYVVIKVTDRDPVNSVSRQQSITSIRKKELGALRIAGVSFVY